FVINGAIGIIWAIIWVAWFKDQPGQHKKVNQQELDYIMKGIPENGGDGKKVQLTQILTSSTMLLTMFQYMASNITFFISFTWLLPYLVSQWGPGAEIYAPIPLVLGMFAQWTSGWLMTVIYNRGFSVMSRKLPAIAGFSIAVAGLLAITLVNNPSPLVFVLLFSVAVFGVEMTISPSWSLCMDIGGDKSGTVSATMNMVGNIGSALSAIVFPFFIANVTIPFFAASKGTANSFFVFAAIMNLLAIFAWLGIKPGKSPGKISAKQARYRLIIFLLAIFLVTAGALLYNFFK
ncbi:MAG: MFS transporter, partial [Mangrovibacterium sp.]|nr:MFS transporter [Mangrovibacterium sp.]